MTTNVFKHARYGGEWMATASATRSAPATALAIFVGLILSWLATYAAGGTHTVMPHLFYVPVVTAATRFGARGAFTVALCAGLFSGPLMPLDVAAGTSQPPLSQFFRLIFFIMIGQAVAFLSNRSFAALSNTVANRRKATELEGALSREEFRVVYQPLFNLTTGRLVGVEALVRWDHPEHGTVPPAMFIGAAEQTGAIVPIGMHVLRTAAAQAVRWRDTYGKPLKVAVNISAAQLGDDTLIGNVAAVLTETGLPASALQLEITETALILDLEEANHRIEKLRNLGVAIAIDDFGTGQSSLVYLHRLHADVIKIDRSFVRVLESDAQARAVTKAIIQMATSVGAVTVAEGIETASQAKILRQLSCDIAQGYYYSPPIDPAEIERLLRSAPCDDSFTAGEIQRLHETTSPAAWVQSRPIGR